MESIPCLIFEAGPLGPSGVMQMFPPDLRILIKLMAARPPFLLLEPRSEFILKRERK